MTEHTAASEATRSLTDEAYERIQHMIVVGALLPYELLSEADLARELNCGRTPVREALQRLKFEGFVEILPRRGALVTPIDVNRQLDLLETRRPLEEQMVRLAARRATTEQRDEMRRLADGLLTAIRQNDRASYLSINKAIHELQAAATQNQFLGQQMKVIHNLSRRFWFSFITDTASFSAAAEWHARTLQAVADGQVDTAVESSHKLLDLLEEAARRSVER